jgi:hypothetical protein
MYPLARARGCPHIDYVASVTCNHLISHMINAPRAPTHHLATRELRGAAALAVTPLMILRAGRRWAFPVAVRRQSAIAAELIYRGRMRSSSTDHERSR